MEYATSGLKRMAMAGHDRYSTAAPGRVKSPARGMVVLAFCLSAACASGDPVTINAVQGDGDASPVAGERVRIRDVVVTAVANRGYFIQQPDGATDDDPLTSEGLYVYGPVPGDLAPGDAVSLEGRVAEFHGHTQLTSVSDLRRVGRRALPEPVGLEAAAAADDLERVESMRVAAPEGVIASPTDEHGEVRIALGGRRPIRGAESPGMRYLPEMDPAGLDGGERTLAAGRRFAAEGVLVYRYGDYVLWPATLRLEAAAPALPRPVRAAADDELAVASYNLRLFYDAHRSGSEPVVDESTFHRRLVKHAAWLRDVLHCPGVVAVQEVEVPEALERLARQSGCGYRAVWGEDPSELALGFLFGPGVDLAGPVGQLGRGLRMPGGGGVLFDRPPLLAVVRTSAGDVALVNVHLRSMRGLGSEPRVAVKRRAQARALGELVRERRPGTGGRLLLLGDFNALPFDDGHADVLALAAHRGEGLFPVWRRLEREERYSYVYRGHGQMLDHALLAPELVPSLEEAAFARGNVDAPASRREDAGTVLGASDHDPLVLILRPGAR